jgi:hypothetical protein
MTALGSLAVVQTNSSPLSGFARIADIHPGGMAAFTDTGHS